MIKAKLLATLGVGVGFLVLISPQAKAGPAGGPTPFTKLVYDLQIIGFDHNKTAPLLGSNRKTIDMPLTTDNCNSQAGCNPAPDVVPDGEIYLLQGPFQVCDGNGSEAPHDCAGNNIQGVNGVPANAIGATFQLPCDNVDQFGNLNAIQCTSSGPGSTGAYQVWVREVGKPGGSLTLTTCANDPFLSNTIICSTNNTGLLIRNSGKPKWSNVTNALTQLVCTNCTAAGGTVTEPLFATGFNGFFWDYDANNNKHLQLRIYAAPK
jgi:hypothetical protein